MRERHWRMLMQTTGKQFVMDERFCLGDLLELELHNYVDACSEIVDRAQKELNIEKQLKKIEDTWAALNLVFNPYMDTDINALTVSYTCLDVTGHGNSCDDMYLRCCSVMPLTGDASGGQQQQPGQHAACSYLGWYVSQCQLSGDRHIGMMSDQCAWLACPADR
jgi:hypothetical protein